jgi:hypothetical protein
MLTKRICLVLGAGASRHYGFPTGGELLDQIIGQQPDEWWPLAAQACDSVATQGFHHSLVSALRSAGSPSIDHFVGKQPRFREYARALIAYHISRGETKPRILQAGKAHDWHNFLMQHVADGAPTLADIPSLDVVTFNFDRSFEEATLLRLSNLYAGAADTEADMRSRVVEALVRWRIVHVHGSLGPLPELAGAGPSRPYEPIVNATQLRAASGRITLLDDAQPDSPEFAHARSIIRESEVVIFLGFAFHRLNCQRVLPADWGPDNHMLYATGFEMSEGAKNKAIQQFLPTRTLNIDEKLANVELLRKFEHVFSN